jgi:two-component system chemotaxis response regulator CheY
MGLAWSEHKVLLMKRCLIADPSEIIRRVARHFLEEAGFEIIEAEAATEALEVCKHRAPDIVLLDWHLPEMTTIEFMSALRFIGGGKRPFVIYCTTDSDPADLERAFSAGADAYLIKPFDRDSLVGTFAENGLAA